MDKNIKFYQDYFTQINWLNIEKDFLIDKNNLYYEARFNVSTSKDTLNFEISIPLNYPKQEMYVVCINTEGYNHQMDNNSLCLTTPPTIRIKDKLNLDTTKIKKWIDDYYIKEKKDNHYEYLDFGQKENRIMLFDGSNSINHNSGDYGVFSYLKFHDREVYIANEFNTHKTSFSTEYLNKQSLGIWVFLQKEPVLHRRKTIKNWNDLLKLLSEDQKKHIFDFRKRIPKETYFFILVGYKIPSKNGLENHWELIWVETLEGKFPFMSRKITNGIYTTECKKNDIINWCITDNISHERFFGRGKLSNKITEANVLILGVGAIGSSLAKILTRGGAKRITISDNDYVEAGNVCRSEYYFLSVYKNKTDDIKEQLISISPFIKVEVLKKLENVYKGTNVFKKQRKKLNHYDLIFDCTTDKQLSVMLDDMILNGEVYNMSISNQANDFVCITGRGIHKKKNEVYSNFYDSEKFYVGTGCWHSTFEASYADINLLLNYAIKELNNKFGNETNANSFKISVSEKDNSTKIELKYVD